MTEAEWLSGKYPAELLAHLNRPPGDRKLWLYEVACCRDLWHLLPEPASRAAVEWAERFADGLAAIDDEYAQLERASAEAFLKYDRLRFETPSDDMTYGGLYDLAEAANLANAVMNLDRSDPHGPNLRQRRGGYSPPLVRDLFGNPFRPVAFDPSWRTEAVVALARGAYESRDFSPMPVLADALEDAGCTAADVLAHCRGPGPHARGCWVVDAVLGKT